MLSPPSFAPSHIVPNLTLYSRRTVASAAAATAASPSPAGGHGRRPLRYAVLGAGFAGLSVAWHLLKVTLHFPSSFSPVKLLWRGAEFWKESMDLLRSAEQANGTSVSNTTSQDDNLIWRRQCMHLCSYCILLYLDKQIYFFLGSVQALFSACQNLADEASSLPSEQKEIKLYKQHVDNLHLLAGNYDSVIICLGAKACSLPELANKLPLRTCRGVIAEFQLPSTTVEEYDSQSASILSDAWLAFQGPRTVSIGSTWQWISENDSSTVSDEESLTAIEELLPKASGVYPRISKWDFVRARAGIRAMPPLTTNGSLPLLGCLDDLLGNKSNCTFWLVGGLGARGLLYHGLVGKLTAKAAISCNENIIPSEFTCWNIVKP
ncbi:FAD-dependent oxidoreductase family protein [Zea mays]|nr:FAD-dependent oxidoreductase family protein [Zea mays]